MIFELITFMKPQSFSPRFLLIWKKCMLMLFRFPPSVFHGRRRKSLLRRKDDWVYHVCFKKNNVFRVQVSVTGPAQRATEEQRLHPRCRTEKSALDQSVKQMREKAS